MGFEPAHERPVRLPQRLEASGIFGGGFNLEPVTDDPRIGGQAVELSRADGSDAIDHEIRKGSTECRAFSENCRPRKTGLVNFEHQPLEQNALVVGRKAALGIMVASVDRIPGG